MISLGQIHTQILQRFLNKKKLNDINRINNFNHALSTHHYIDTHIHTQTRTSTHKSIVVSSGELHRGIINTYTNLYEEFFGCHQRLTLLCEWQLLKGILCRDGLREYKDG